MKYVTTRAITKDECPWIDADIPEGTPVYRFTGYTYGCIGPNGIAVRNDPDVGPFFELPRAALAKEDEK